MINRMQTAKVLAVRRLTDSAYVLRLERNGFEFVPGQCVNLGLKDLAVNREYSTYSGLADDFLEFLIKRVDGGLVSNALAKLGEGDEVSLDGAYGLFTLKAPENLSQGYVFIGSGTGIAPFHAFVRSFPKIDYRTIHGVRFSSEQYDKNDYAAERYLSCVSRERGGGFYGRVTDYLQKETLDADARYYLCGNSAMINDVYDILRSVNVSGSNIFTEVFF